MEQLALPPASTESMDQPKGFDVDAEVQRLKSQPKQDYTGEWTKQEAPKEPPKTETPPTGDGPTAEPGAADPNASAKEFIEVYDTLQSAGFHMWSGQPIDKFLLDKSVKDRAAHHLAKGLEKMGSPELPWWLGVVICLAPPTFFNWLAAREAVKAAREKEEREAQRTANQQRQQAGHPFQPSTVTRPNGEVIQLHPDQAPPPAPAANAVHAGSCVVCGKPTKVRKGVPGKYCSQSCSGKGRATKK